jgi:hypothetical protein
MGAANRLGHDAIDDAEREQVLRRHLHRLGRFGAFSAVRHRIEAQPSGEITE